MPIVRSARVDWACSGLLAGDVPDDLRFALWTQPASPDSPDLKGLGVQFTQDATDLGPVVTAVFDDTCGNLIQIATMARDVHHRVERRGRIATSIYCRARAESPEARGDS